MEDRDIIALYLERNQESITETEKNTEDIVIPLLITYFTTQKRGGGMVHVDYETDCLVPIAGGILSPVDGVTITNY